MSHGTNSLGYLSSLELYCFARAFLGDLIPKGEKCGSKQGMFPTKGERRFQKGKEYSKGGEMPSGSSQHMREE